MIRAIALEQYEDVGAVASLGNDLYIVCLSNDELIQVYDCVSLQPKTPGLSVPGLGYFRWGLAACGRYECVYVSDWSNDRVHRVKLSGNCAVVCWSVASRPAGLSVTTDHNLLVVSQGDHKLQEFSTHGIPLRELKLAADDSPWQAVQLPNNYLILTHFGSTHSVSVILPDLETCSVSHGGMKGSSPAQLNRPAGLAVDKAGRVLVADWYNNRLVVLRFYSNERKPGALYVRGFSELSVSIEGGLKGPCSLWYDQELRRLYIGECERNGHRVIVIDNLDDFKAAAL